MDYTRQIVIFANSRRPGGRCIAGKEWLDGKPGEWIRAVSDREKQSIWKRERCFVNGNEPKLLERVSISFLEEQPSGHQVENHLIDASRKWRLENRLDYEELADWCDEPENLWVKYPDKTPRINGGPESTTTGLNNRVPRRYMNESEYEESLYLLSLDAMHVHVEPKHPEHNPNLAVRAQFDYRNVGYRMDVTDPVAERIYLEKGEGEYLLDHPFACISLTTESHGYCYKLVATIIHEELCE